MSLKQHLFPKKLNYRKFRGKSSFAVFPIIFLKLFNFYEKDEQVFDENCNGNRVCEIKIKIFYVETACA